MGPSAFVARSKGVRIMFIKNLQDWNTEATHSDLHRAGLRPPCPREDAAFVLEGSLPQGPPPQQHRALGERGWQLWTPSWA